MTSPNPSASATPTLIDPNTAHQRWSKWVFVVEHTQRKGYPPYSVAEFNDAKTRFGRMARRQFGTSGFANVQTQQHRVSGLVWAFQVIVDTNHPHDPEYVAHMKRGWTRFFKEGFGPQCRVRIEHKLLAGDWQNGRPADQMVIMDLMAIPVFADADPDRPPTALATSTAATLRSRFQRLFSRLR